MFKYLIAVLFGILNLVSVAFAAEMPIISNVGFGVVNGASQFAPDTIQALFPDYEVKLETYFAEGDEYVTLVVSNGDELIAKFNEDDGGFWDAFAYSPLIMDVNGIHTGMLAQELPKTVLASCRNGVEDGAEKLLCSSKATPNIQYWIDGAELSALSKISAIRWLPE